MPLPVNIEKIKELTTVFIIFGATGDLSRKKIFPSFFKLYQSNLLPKKIKIIAAARSLHSTESFAEILKETTKIENKKDWENFTKTIEYFSCDIDQNVNLDSLNQRLESLEGGMGNCPKRIFYMAVSPTIYENAFENLARNKLNLGCTVHNNPSRIVTEKPFGYDFKSAQRLNVTLNKYFSEEQIFRIDHFLGKGTVQNILALRFANEIFEPIWNNEFVDHVQITFMERAGIEKRGAFYDKIGALRDVVQNHIFQLLALITMEEPKKLDHINFREKRVKIIKNIKKMTKEEIINSTVRGQYEDYRQEENVNRSSRTETFAALRLYIDSQRWQNVPFYIRTGKKLAGDVTSIILSFKEKGHKIFKNFWDQPIPNHINIQIKPTEGIGIRLAVKKPGLAQELEPVDMEFCYKDSFDQPNPDAYEQLLMDIMIGDRTLFLGKVGYSWKVIDPIEEIWASGKPKLAIYKAGSWGPKEADDLIERDGRRWLSPILTICKI